MDLSSHSRREDNALRLSSDGSNKLELSISLMQFKGVSDICRVVNTDDHELDLFWFSWSLFGNVFQSNRFGLGSEGLPEPEVDKIVVQCSDDTIKDRVHNASPLSIYLCATNTVIAAANVPLDANLMIGSEQPFVDQWFEFAPIGDYESICRGLISSIHTVITIDPLENQIEMNSERDGDEYDEDEFEQQVTDALDASTLDSPAHHYRFSVQVRSVAGLKHAANACVHFTYPHLGASGSVVRTRPTWCISHTENQVHGAVATYECCLTVNDFKAAVLENPLFIVVDTRNNLGFSPLGTGLVSLDGLLRSKPYSYRCPLTGKSFKDISSYRSHRNALSVAASRQDAHPEIPGSLIGKIPPHDPVVVLTTDAYYALRRDGGSGDVVGKVRVMLILEDMGAIKDEALWPVRSGYKQQNGAVYELPSMDPAETEMPLPPMQQPSSAADHDNALDQQQIMLQQRLQEWEAWQRDAEEKWRESLREKEAQLRATVTAEASANLAQRADDLKRAHEEAARLEVRLRNSIEAAERQKYQLELKEEQMKTRLAQKTAELQLLQRRVRDEARAKIEVEARRAENAEKRHQASEEARERAEKRAAEAEKDFDVYRHHIKSLPETALREELSKARAQLAEARESIERERRLRTEVELEREHFKAQMHRLALALKREREKSAVVARQELEQLRLEFLAREERFLFFSSYMQLCRYVLLYFLIFLGIFWTATERSCGVSGVSCQLYVLCSSLAHIDMPPQPQHMKTKTVVGYMLALQQITKSLLERVWDPSLAMGLFERIVGTFFISCFMRERSCSVQACMMRLML